MKSILSIFLPGIFILLVSCDPLVDQKPVPLPVHATFRKDDLEKKAVVQAVLEKIPNILGPTVSTGRIGDLSVPQDNITLTKGYDEALGRPFIATLYLSDFYKIDLPAEQKTALYNNASLKDVQQMSEEAYVKKIRPGISEEELPRYLYKNFTVVKSDTVKISGRTAYFTEMTFDVAGDTRKSYMYVFAYNDTLMMKLRISYQESMSKTFDAERFEYVKALEKALTPAGK